MKALFDTNILVDYLKGRQEAAREIARHPERIISRITWMETLAGAPDGGAEEETRRFLDCFDVIELTPAIAERAVALRREGPLTRISHRESSRNGADGRGSEESDRGSRRRSLHYAEDSRPSLTKEAQPYPTLQQVGGEISGLQLPDAIILATARETGAILVTRNTKDFNPAWPDVREPYRL